jgi:[acyl-carrier-protein] S-malonyltransferase
MKIAVCFAGQGAQHPAMMQDIYQSYPESRTVFEIAREALGRDIAGLCFHGRSEDLNLTQNTQPCVLASDLAAWEALRTHGIQLSGVAGFSLGEYAALTAAGAISMRDAFTVVQSRADAMQESGQTRRGGAVAVLSKDLDKVRHLVERVTSGYVAISNYNCPGQVVVSGETQALDEFASLARAERVYCVPIPMSVPVHCMLMEPAAQTLEHLLSSIAVGEPQVKLYMNVDGKPVHHPEDIRRNLVRQMVSPVQWETVVREMYSDGIDTFIECGPGTTLSGFIKRIVPDVVALHVRDLGSLHDTLVALGVVA